MKIFVYGSLKPGGWSHHLLEGRVEEDPVQGSVRGSLYNAGNFPALKIDYKSEVQGFLYTVKEGEYVTLLRTLDRLEGYPNLFGRCQMGVRVGNCVEFASVYYGIDEYLFKGERIESGIWDV
jgi:gamma-glutamylcyclotransferase (GGCT)/AIG2-like uncharacterized protein YtfP